jgi:hypothetical protein
MKIGDANHGRVFTRKEKEEATKKEMGSGYHRRFANECIGCGTSWSGVPAMSWEQSSNRNILLTG